MGQEEGRKSNEEKLRRKQKICHSKAKLESARFSYGEKK